MSTKIYNAYSVPIVKLSMFTKYFNNFGIKYVSKEITSLMDFIKKESLVAIDVCSKDISAFDEEFQLKFRKLVYIFNWWMQSSKENEYSKYNFDLSFNVFIENEMAYIIPYFSDNRMQRKFILPKYCNDFCYFNNVDRPDNVSDKEWEDRRKVWERIALKTHEYWNYFRFEHIVFQAYWRSNITSPIGLTDIEKIVLGKENLDKIWGTPTFIAYNKMLDDYAKNAKNAKNETY